MGKKVIDVEEEEEMIMGGGEEQFLRMLLRMGRNIIDAQDGCMYFFDGTSFSLEDFFRLATKLGFGLWEF